MPFWKKKKPIEVLDAARTDPVNPKAERITSFDTLVQPSEGGSGIPYTDESLRREEGRWGLFVLEDQHDDDPDAIDIVALHGLNGHWEYTWTTRNARGEEVLWLRDLLPLQVPHARVMSFGYDSVLQFSKSVAHIGTFADQLLESLMSRRTGGSSKRPIIFVCHSLGGIVVKKVESRLLISSITQRLILILHLTFRQSSGLTKKTATMTSYIPREELSSLVHRIEVHHSPAGARCSATLQVSLHLEPRRTGDYRKTWKPSLLYSVIYQNHLWTVLRIFNLSASTRLIRWTFSNAK